MTEKTITTLLKKVGEFAEPETSKLGSQISKISKSKRRRLLMADETDESTSDNLIKETVESVQMPQLEVNAEEAPKAKRPKFTLKKQTAERDAISKIQGEADADEVHIATSTGIAAPVQVPATEATLLEKNLVEDQADDEEEADASTTDKTEADAAKAANDEDVYLQTLIS